MEKQKFVQACNPKTKRYVKIDKEIGSIVSHKKSPGPYKGVDIVGRRYDLEDRA